MSRISKFSKEEKIKACQDHGKNHVSFLQHNKRNWS